MANEYADYRALKTMRGIEVDEFDTALKRVIGVASRRIDNRCNRVFYASDSAKPRVFATAGRTIWRRRHAGELLLIDDIHSTTDLTVEVGDGDDFDELESSAYELEPLAPQPGWPWEEIRRRRSTWRWASHVRITAFWGWATIPEPIEEATLILANRLYLRKDSPEGVAGSTEWGAMNLRALDPDVEDLIGPYVIHAPGGDG